MQCIDVEDSWKSSRNIFSSTVKNPTEVPQISRVAWRMFENELYLRCQGQCIVRRVNFGQIQQKQEEAGGAVCLL